MKVQICKTTDITNLRKVAEEICNELSEQNQKNSYHVESGLIIETQPDGGVIEYTLISTEEVNGHLFALVD